MIKEWRVSRENGMDIELLHNGKLCYVLNYMQFSNAYVGSVLGCSVELIGEDQLYEWLEDYGYEEWF